MNGSRELIARFQRLTRGTKWTLVDKVELQFNNYHAQGMVRIGELFYLSSVELDERPRRYDVPQQRYDRSPGRGRGHLFAFDRQGRLVHDVALGEGTVYHPGGIDFDGEHIWVPVAEYRPHSKSIVYKIDAVAMKAEKAFRVGDHIGGVVRDRQTGHLVGNSWGSRTFYEWDETGRQLRAADNLSHFVDYQDGHYVGDGKMLLSGIAELPGHAATAALASLGGGGSGGGAYELGGLALIDIRTFRPIHEVPVTELSPHGHVITRNPVLVECAGGAGRELRLYAVPDDDCGSLLVYETSGLGG
jgi:hypothetical protein